MAEIKETDGQIVFGEKLERLFESAEPYFRLMMQYRCAIKEIQTKFEVLNEEFSVHKNRNPVETIKTRIKTPRSIAEKLRRRGYEISEENIREHIHDVAGIRVVCSFIDDIYVISRMFTSQDDIVVLQVKDYIRNPKPNGYRSLHIIIEVPIFLSDSKQYVKAEVQFRTIAMDFWASLEHKLRYKQAGQTGGEISERLRQCANEIDRLDQQMQSIREAIEQNPGS